MLAAKLLAGGGTETLYAEDVFQSYTRTGTGASATVTTGVDMTQGYMLWTKGRSGATDHALYHSARGVTKDLVHNTTAAETTQATGLTAVSATGHTIGALAKMNTTSATYVDWVFRNADKFYNHTTVVKSGGSNATVSFANLTTLGMVRVKRTDSTGSWYIWHRSLTAGKLLIGETTAAEATLGHITVSGTTVTLVNGVIADGTYLVEGFAHDTGTDGIIQCGSFTTDGSGNATVSLGWESQFLIAKRASGVGDWNLLDISRGMAVTPGSSNTAALYANTSGAEVAGANNCYPIATGFYVGGMAASNTYIYLAIRRPNKPPTTGAQVYNAIARTGDGVAKNLTGVGFAPDSVLFVRRTPGASPAWNDKLRGPIADLFTPSTSQEDTAGVNVTGWNPDGVNIGTGASINVNTTTYINWFFRRAPGVFDVVCFTGQNGPWDLPHNLGTPPELVIIKTRTGTYPWSVWVSGISNANALYLNTTAAIAASIGGTPWNGAHTASVVKLGNDPYAGSTTGPTYVAYLFATLAGISKVGSYTGNGSTQTIACGFTTGARFILIKRTDSTGDWYVWDTVRGIVSGNDPHLSLNTTAAEVATDDSIDPDTSGFIVNQLAATNINVNAASYIYLSFS